MFYVVFGWSELRKRKAASIREPNMAGQETPFGGSGARRFAEVVVFGRVTARVRGGYQMWSEGL